MGQERRKRSAKEPVDSKKACIQGPTAQIPGLIARWFARFPVQVAHSGRVVFDTCRGPRSPRNTRKCSNKNSDGTIFSDGWDHFTSPFTTFFRL